MANKQIKHTQKCPTSLACHFTVVVESCWINRNMSLARGKSTWTLSLKVNIVALNCVPRRDTVIWTLGDPRMLFISMFITGGGERDRTHVRDSSRMDEYMVVYSHNRMPWKCWNELRRMQHNLLLLETYCWRKRASPRRLLTICYYKYFRTQNRKMYF